MFYKIRNTKLEKWTDKLIGKNETSKMVKNTNL